jgi:3-phosphoshikimate 1-carboxyvinyltransferase
MCSIDPLEGAVRQKENTMRTVSRVQARSVIIQAPPAKAYTLRALLMGALATGKTVLHHPLLADDQLNMIACLRDLGIIIDQETDRLTIHGLSGRFHPTVDKLFVGDSGVTMNSLISAACFADKPITLSGTPRLNERPVKEVVDGIRQLGAKVEYLGLEGFPPVRIYPSGLKGGRTAIHGAVTSQYFSSIAMSAALASSPVSLVCIDTMTEKPYFDITTSMMTDFGLSPMSHDYKTINIPAPQNYLARDYLVEGDFSSASFLFLAAAVLVSSVRVDGLNSASVQGDKRFLDLLKRMGCQIIWDKTSVTVIGGDLVAIEEDMNDIPDLVPPMAVAAAFARGESRFSNIAHLVHKESNRVAAMETELLKMGVLVNHDNDSMTVTGNRSGIHGAKVATYNDHRIAMSLAIAGLVTGDQHIENPDCVAKSFPDFWEKLAIF